MEYKELLLDLVSVTNKGWELIPHKDYEIKQDGEKFYLVKKKKEYPKTYEECCKVIGINRHDVEIDLPQPYQQKMFNLYKLLICRDAYWKIAGDEMGLGKPWEPNWEDINAKYSIFSMKGITRQATSCYDNAIFAFPTPEMRDAFYENFKVLIESCKELL